MKTVNNSLKMLLVSGFLFTNVQLVNAQDCKCPEVAINSESEPSTVLVFLGENDYPNFLNISGLKKYSNVITDKSVDSFAEITYYRVESSNKNTKLFATYSADGKLITGYLTTKNIRLPRAVLVFLVQNHKDWTMTSNKSIVTDFDALRTEYEVKVKKDRNKKTLYFDYAGQPISRLARS